MLQQFISCHDGTNDKQYISANHITNCSDIDDSNDDVRRLLSSYASIAAGQLCRIQIDDNPKKRKKERWKELQDAAEMLQTITPRSGILSLESNALAVSLVYGSLSIQQRYLIRYQNQQQYQQDYYNYGSAKAAASALSATILKNKSLQETGRYVSACLLKSYINDAQNCFFLDLNILKQFAKAFQLTTESSQIMSAAVVVFVRKSIAVVESPLSQRTNINDNNNDDDDNKRDATENEKKQIISGALAFTCQVRPWSHMSPIELIDLAVAHDYYSAAEEICRTAYETASIRNDADSTSCISSSEQLINTRCAVELLIDRAMEDRKYRRADALSTNLYDMGGSSRYIDARYFHARDTIAKVILKRQLPIVDRIIERIDKAVDKVNKSQIDHGDKSAATKILSSYSTSIRKYAIEKMEEVGEIMAAQRLASLYDIDYVHDKQAAVLGEILRRRKYLQYEDALAGAAPSLITTPAELLLGFNQLLENGKARVFGFDAEWNEDPKGVALLQICNSNIVLLIDVPCISLTQEGIQALASTVGKLMDSPLFTVVGFSCRQDLSRLRSSPPHDDKTIDHWMAGTRSVVDLQTLAGNDEPSLLKAGLSRVCEYYLSKPLDKSEQCSSWSDRPLSERQRSYAALDAWVCVGVYNKLAENIRQIKKL